MVMMGVTDLDLLLALVGERVPAVLALLLVDGNLLLCVLVPGLLFTAGLTTPAAIMPRRFIMRRAVVVLLRQTRPERGGRGGLPSTLNSYQI